MNVYLNRFLNTPPAELPDRQAVEADPEAIREDLLETFDEEGEVNAAARLAADYLDAGGDPAALGRMLGHALLCEDATFHML